MILKVLGVLSGLVALVAAILSGIWWLFNHVFKLGQFKEHFESFEKTIERNFNSLEKQFNTVDEKFNNVEKKLEDFNGDCITTVHSVSELAKFIGKH